MRNPAVIGGFGSVVDRCWRCSSSAKSTFMICLREMMIKIVIMIIMIIIMIITRIRISEIAGLRVSIFNFKV